MSMPTDAVEALHEATAALKAEHERRDAWLSSNDGTSNSFVYDANGCAMPPDSLHVTRAEAEAIFAQRIAAHESRLKELGWTRTIRVEPSPQPAGATT